MSYPIHPTQRAQNFRQIVQAPHPLLAGIRALETNQVQREQARELLTQTQVGAVSLLSLLLSIARQEPVSIYLTGSRAHRLYKSNQYDQESDLDLLILVHDNQVSLQGLLNQYFHGQYQKPTVHESRFAKISVGSEIDITFTRSPLRECYHFAQAAISYDIFHELFTCPEIEMERLRASREPGKLFRCESENGYTYDTVFAFLWRLTKGFYAEGAEAQKVFDSLWKYQTQKERKLSFQLKFSNLLEGKFSADDNEGRAAFLVCAYLQLEHLKAEVESKDIALLQEALREGLAEVVLPDGMMGKFARAILQEGTQLNEVWAEATVAAEGSRVAWNRSQWDPLFSLGLSPKLRSYPNLGIGFSLGGKACFIPHAAKDRYYWLSLLKTRKGEAFREHREELQQISRQHPQFLSKILEYLLAEEEEVLREWEEFGGEISKQYLLLLLESCCAGAWSRLAAHAKIWKRWGHADLFFRENFVSKLALALKENQAPNAVLAREFLLATEKWPVKNRKALWNPFYRALPKDSPFVIRDISRVKQRLGLSKAMEQGSPESLHFVIQAAVQRSDSDRKRLLSYSLMDEDALLLLKEWAPWEQEVVLRHFEQLLQSYAFRDEAFALLRERKNGLEPEFAFSLFESMTSEHQRVWAEDLMTLSRDNKEFESGLEQMRKRGMRELRQIANQSHQNIYEIGRWETVLTVLPCTVEEIRQIVELLSQTAHFSKRGTEWVLRCIENGAKVEKRLLNILFSESLLIEFQRRARPFPYFLDFSEKIYEANRDYFWFCFARQLQSSRGLDKLVSLAIVFRSDFAVREQSLFWEKVLKAKPQLLLQLLPYFQETIVSLPGAVLGLIAGTDKQLWLEHPSLFALASSAHLSDLPTAKRLLWIGACLEMGKISSALVNLLLDEEVPRRYLLSAFPKIVGYCESMPQLLDKLLEGPFTEEEKGSVWNALTTEQKIGELGGLILPKIDYAEGIFESVCLMKEKGDQDQLSARLPQLSKDWGSFKGRALAALYPNIEGGWRSAALWIWENIRGEVRASEIFWLCVADRSIPGSQALGYRIYDCKDNDRAYHALIDHLNKGILWWNVHSPDDLPGEVVPIALQLVHEFLVKEERPFENLSTESITGLLKAHFLKYQSRTSLIIFRINELLMTNGIPWKQNDLDFYAVHQYALFLRNNTSIPLEDFIYIAGLADKVSDVFRNSFHYVRLILSLQVPVEERRKNICHSIMPCFEFFKPGKLLPFSKEDFKKSDIQIADEFSDDIIYGKGLTEDGIEMDIEHRLNILLGLYGNPPIYLIFFKKLKQLYLSDNCPLPENKIKLLTYFMAALADSSETYSFAIGLAEIAEEIEANSPKSGDLIFYQTFSNSINSKLLECHMNTKEKWEKKQLILDKLESRLRSSFDASCFYDMMHIHSYSNIGSSLLPVEANSMDELMTHQDGYRYFKWLHNEVWNLQKCQALPHFELMHFEKNRLVSMLSFHNFAKEVNKIEYFRHPSLVSEYCLEGVRFLVKRVELMNRSWLLMMQNWDKNRYKHIAMTTKQYQSKRKELEFNPDYILFITERQEQDWVLADLFFRMGLKMAVKDLTPLIEELSESGYNPARWYVDRFLLHFTMLLKHKYSNNDYLEMNEYVMTLCRKVMAVPKTDYSYLVGRSIGAVLIMIPDLRTRTMTMVHFLTVLRSSTIPEERKLNLLHSLAQEDKQSGGAPILSMISRDAGLPPTYKQYYSKFYDDA